MSECPYCINSFEMTETCHDEFRMWQGLVGPYYIPTIEDGILTWTNTGGLPNPNPINIIGAQGNGLYIGGIAETTGDLPETAENGVTWLVGADEPYEGYVYLNGSWVDIGAVTPGPTGPQGIPGVGVPSGGTTGQVLQKASNSDYQTEWADPASGGDPPGTMLPLMDGTAAVGTARSYAREDHVHPTDTSRGSASDVDALKTSLNDVETKIGKILPVITGATNNSGYTIASGDYFEANGSLYKATASIPVGSAWSTSATAQTGTAINTVNNSVVDQTPGNTVRIGCAFLPGVGLYDQVRFFVPFPFLAKNTNYSISNTSLEITNVGVLPLNVYFKTENGFGAYGSVQGAGGPFCVGSVYADITFA